MSDVLFPGLSDISLEGGDVFVGFNDLLFLPCLIIRALNLFFLKASHLRMELLHLILIFPCIVFVFIHEVRVGFLPLLIVASNLGDLLTEICKFLLALGELLRATSLGMFKRQKLTLQLFNLSIFLVIVTFQSCCCIALSTLNFGKLFHEICHLFNPGLLSSRELTIQF